MKKIFLILLCFMLIFSISGCSVSNDEIAEAIEIESAEMSQMVGMVEIVEMKESTEILVKFNSKADIKKIQGEHNLEYKSTIPKIEVAVFKSKGRIPVDRVIEALNRNPNVEFAELNDQVTVQLVPNDPMYKDQINLPQINATRGWDISVGSSSIVIAILDTGVYAHTDLADKIISGWNFIDNNNNTNDVRGHGTHVAGITTALTNNNKGMAGVDWEARIMPVKVLNDSGSGTYAGVANGIIYAADNNADVINMSLGGSGYSEALELACQYAYDKGVTIIAAAGNSGGGVMYPAKFDTVIAVSAVDRDDIIASFSSRGSEIMVAAPGVSIWSTYPGSSPTYVTMSGTSMAAPHVAGLAGLVLSTNDYSPEEVLDLLTMGAFDLGVDGWDYLYGYGRIDIYETLLLTIGDETPLPDEPETYEITISTDPLNSGQISGGGLYKDGSQVTISVFPNNSYDFINWTLNEVEVSRNLNYTFTVNSNQHYVANLKLKEYILSYSASTGGYIQGNSMQIVKHGESGTQVTAMPSDNYIFDKWSDGVTNASRIDTNITANLSLTAYFKYVEPEPEPEPDYKEIMYSGSIGHRNQPQQLSYSFDAIGGNIEIELTWTPWKSELGLYLYDQQGNLVTKSDSPSGRDSRQYISTDVNIERYTIVAKSISGQGNFTLVIKNRS